MAKDTTAKNAGFAVLCTFFCALGTTMILHHWIDWPLSLGIGSFSVLAWLFFWALVAVLTD